MNINSGIPIYRSADSGNLGIIVRLYIIYSSWQIMSENDINSYILSFKERLFIAIVSIKKEKTEIPISGKTVIVLFYIQRVHPTWYHLYDVFYSV